MCLQIDGLLFLQPAGREEEYKASVLKREEKILPPSLIMCMKSELQNSKKGTPPFFTNNNNIIIISIPVQCAVLYNSTSKHHAHTAPRFSLFATSVEIRKCAFLYSGMAVLFVVAVWIDPRPTVY